MGSVAVGRVVGWAFLANSIANVETLPFPSNAIPPFLFCAQEHFERQSRLDTRARTQRLQQIRLYEKSRQSFLEQQRKLRGAEQKALEDEIARKQVGGTGVFVPAGCGACHHLFLESHDCATTATACACVSAEAGDLRLGAAVGGRETAGARVASAGADG